jgi:hypothetical protein
MERLISRQLSTEEEARLLLSQKPGNDSFSYALGIVQGQFAVIQSRFQFLITLSALALTITGFSGPKIAASNDFSRYTMAIGLVFVLLTTLLLLGSLQLKWVTQISGETPQKSIEAMLRSRDHKTQLFGIKLILLAIGLSFYVVSVVYYFLSANSSN